MCTTENTIKYDNDNEKSIEYDIYGDTRNNKKYNEEKNTANILITSLKSVEQTT